MFYSPSGMVTSRVTDSDILAKWKRMNEKRIRVCSDRAKFRVAQHVRISKEKMKFVKGAEQNFSTAIFRIATVKERRPRPIYELEDFYRTPSDGQFYQEELTPVRVTRSRVYKIHEILDE